MAIYVNGVLAAGKGVGSSGDPGIPAGGVAGQVLAKNSNAPYDAGWVDPPEGGNISNISLTAETLPAGSEATVTKTGSSDNPVFQLGIPRGEQGLQGAKGDKGDKGDTGPQGPSGTFTAGTADYTAGSTPLATGTLYLVYE